MIQLSWVDGRLRLHPDRLSVDQRAALRCDREIAVSAGAGAGKTSTLAARYVTLLAELVAQHGGAADIRSILVLTFTEKAAQEMRERCYAMTTAVARGLHAGKDRLMAEGASASAIARERAAWDRLRDSFAGAAIGTFHGFCARLLREFPAETATAPGFTVLDEASATEHTTRSATDAVDAALAQQPPDLGLLLDTFRGRAGFVDAVVLGLRDRSEVQDALRFDPPRPDPEPLRLLLERTWRPVAARIVQLCDGSTTAPMTALRGALAAPVPEAAEELGALLAWGVGAVLTDDGVARKLDNHAFKGTKAAWGTRTPPSKADLASLQDEIDTWPARFGPLALLPNPHDRTLRLVRAALLPVMRDAVDRLSAELRAANAVDFSELLLRVGAAVRDAPELVRQLAARHRYVMVDEFQDTDALQWQIVTAIARPEGATRDRLFVVGDVKQAIYGFRGGDVSVFDAAVRTIKEPCTLAENYRSRPNLIAVFNQVFEAVLGPPADGRPPWEAPFAALEARRPDPGGEVVHLRYAGKPDPEREAEATARFIAARLRSDAADPHALALGDRGRHPTPPVAILLRRRTHLPTFESALRAEGVPYVVVGGIGFWHRPEVRDVVHTLIALVRKDAIARVGALRSPLFGLTDQDLVDLHNRGQLDTFGQGDAPPLGPRVTRAWDTWGRLRAARDHVAPVELTRRVIDETRAGLTVELAAPGGRGAANLVRLLELAAEHTARGATLDAFVTRLLAAVAAEDRHAEASLPTTDARVAILTVHASKGLEFPVVVVPDLGAPMVRPSKGETLRARIDGVERIAMPVPDRYGPWAINTTPSELARLRHHHDVVGAAESKRLFYVACTRARDALVVVGPSSEGDRSPRTWSDLWALGLANPRGAVVADVDLDATPLEAAPPLPAAAASRPPADLTRRIAPVLAPARLEVPPSSLDAAARDLDAWLLARHGVPELGPPSLARDAAGLLGDVLHGLLEDAVLDDTTASARWNARAADEGLDAAATSSGESQLRAQLATMRTSAEVAAVLDARGLPELKVAYTHGGVTIAGRVDRLVRDPVDGAWMVVDFKSGRSAADEHRWQLLAYSVAASRVLEAHGQGRVARAAILRTRTGTLHRLPDWTEDDHAALDALLERLAAASG